MARDEFKPAKSEVEAATTVAEPAEVVAKDGPQAEPQPKGKKPSGWFEVELKHLPTYVVKAKSEDDAARQYLELHGILATDHQIRVSPLESREDSEAEQLPKPKEPVAG